MQFGPDRPRRIALIIHALYGGGAERIISQLANRWSEAGQHVRLITLSNVRSDQYELAPQVERLGLDLMKPSRNFLGAILANRQRILAVRRAILDFSPDFVLSFSDKMNIVSLNACRGKKIPIWISERSDPRQQKLDWPWEWARRSAYPRSTGCVVQTTEIKACLSHLISPACIVVIPNAVCPPPGLPPSAQTRNIEELAARKNRLVLAMGRLSHEKGIDVLLDAWARVCSSLPDWELKIAGQGIEQAHLVEQSRALGIQSSVQFLGWQKDPWPLYREADLFVLPSRYEGFPVALLEAMSMGLPSIATECSQAVDELSCGGSAIYRVPVGDAHALATGLRLLTESSDRRTEMGRIAHQTAAAYHWDRIGPAWDNLLSMPSEPDRK